MEKLHPQCAKCTVVRCRTKDANKKVPPFCPTEKYRDLVEECAAKLMLPENQAINKAWLGYISKVVNPERAKQKVAWTRVDEIMEYARLRGMKKIGIGTCGELLHEAKLLTEILEANGFEVVSVICLCGELDPQKIGLPFERTCNPIMQAEVLNREKTGLNIMLGLCLGHDIMFLRNCKAETTPLIVKDRALGHNPAAALYMSKNYVYNDRFFGNKADVADAKAAVSADGEKKKE